MQSCLLGIVVQVHTQKVHLHWANAGAMSAETLAQHWQVNIGQAEFCPVANIGTLFARHPYTSIGPTKIQHQISHWANFGPTLASHLGQRWLAIWIVCGTHYTLLIRSQSYWLV